MRARVDKPRLAPRRRRVACVVACIWSLGGAACGPDDPPENPGWADVAPILQAQCTGCHGATAATTGNSFRFDFYDMTADPCGDAATVLTDVSLARAQSEHIARAITSTDASVRPEMPPLPAPYLSDNEWLTLLRWTANPIKGDKPPANRPPQITVEGTSPMVDRMMEVSIIVKDPEGDPVVGLLKVGDRVVGGMDRSGAFSARFDTSSWPEGAVSLSALLCDGWSLVSADLLEISIHH